VLSLLPERLEQLLLLGAHCDDIAIGAGGTLLELCRAHPSLRVTALVCSGGGSAREVEEHAALAALCPGAKLEIIVLDLPDTLLPTCWATVKAELRGLRERIDPDLVMMPAPHDAHQDHRTLARLVPTAFRDHLALGYELVKWESDLAQPQVFLPVPSPVLEEKVGALLTHYPSQRDRPWFDRDVFAGLARVRGVQCGARYAEAFHVNKLMLGAGPVEAEPSVGEPSCECC
jgi:LmbE family N-acetylglucosaminyl deacetylase